MLIFRKLALHDDEFGGYQVGDQIRVGRFYTATCQKVNKNSAIFMFDQGLDLPEIMNAEATNVGGYIASDLRRYFIGFSKNTMFDEIRPMMIPFEKTGDLLRIPVAEEIFGPEEVHNEEVCETLSNKKQWILMKNYPNNRILFRGEDKAIDKYWLQNRYMDSNSHFAICSRSGKLGSFVSSAHCAVRVVFKLSLNKKEENNE